MKNLQQIFFLCVVILFSIAQPQITFSAAVPALKARVNDYGAILSQQTKQELEQKLTALESSDSTQLVILTIPSLEGDSLEEYSMRVVEEWKIGQKDLDNGALLLISKGDRKIRIEVGYGLEGNLTDLMAGRIINNIITPAFKQGDFDKGVTLGIEAMTKAVQGEFSASDIQSGGSRSSKIDFEGMFTGIFFITFIMLRPLTRTFSMAGPIGGAIVFPLIGWFMGAGPLLLLVLLIIGAVIGYIMMKMPVSTGNSSGSSWGGSSSSGGGFGGFSGGGGGFGGGGASGGW